MLLKYKTLHFAMGALNKYGVKWSLKKRDYYLLSYKELKRNIKVSIKIFDKKFVEKSKMNQKLFVNIFFINRTFKTRNKLKLV